MGAEDLVPGRVEVYVQEYRGLPVQVRANGLGEQARVALPDRFNDTLKRALLATNGDFYAERRWRLVDIRAGSAAEVAQMVVEEIACLDDAELADLEAAACGLDVGTIVRYTSAVEHLFDVEPARRLKAVRELAVDAESFRSFVRVLAGDQHAAIRRCAAARLGSAAIPDAVGPLCRTLTTDPSSVVRRAAGDALAELADPRATGAMAAALQDPSKVVRWRAARFLRDHGGPDVAEALRQTAGGEREREVRREMEAALARLS